MKTSDFHFNLPKELIASEPLAQRSASRLMCLTDQGDIAHHHFYDLPDLLKEGDLLIFNNSKVIPARLYAKKSTGGAVEILIERVIDDYTALAHVKGAKTLKAGAKLSLIKDKSSASDDGMAIEIGTRHDDLLALTATTNWYDVLDEYGHIPLPPYMERADREDDKSRYQTVYAAPKGSVAAPTAGLHFDDDLFARLKVKGINSAFVTLHVGAGTFQPVRVDDISEHKMHSERFEISQKTIDQINAAKQNGGRIIAVGTTSVRVLESAAAQNSLIPAHGETDIFITPGYKFKVIDGLITNFHLPESTLLMLVSALMGKENILNAYDAAISEKYRFFSYGDAMLLKK